MRIPAFMTTWQDGGLRCTDGWFHGTVPGKGSRTVPFHEAVSEGTVKEVRSPAVVVDLDSLGRRYFDEKVMKNMKVRGADIWFMTYIQDADDVFDAFNTDADMLLAPYHTIRSREDLEDIHSVSDCVIPVVYCVGGRAVIGRGRTDDVPSVLDSLADIGFYRTCVLDTDGSVTGREWLDVHENYPSAIPFSNSELPPSHGFQTVIAPFHPR